MVNSGTGAKSIRGKSILFVLLRGKTFLVRAERGAEAGGASAAHIGSAGASVGRKIGACIHTQQTQCWMCRLAGSPCNFQWILLGFVREESGFNKAQSELGFPEIRKSKKKIMVARFKRPVPTCKIEQACVLHAALDFA